jgi:acyl carrier protein
MHFGESVREVLSKSCGRDLRAARSRTVLPGIDSPEVQRRLAADLEESFDITLSPEDVAHLTTVRAVLQCVRLRRWERETAPATEHAAPITVAAPPLRERFVRYTPPAAPVPMPVATSSSFALRKS